MMTSMQDATIYVAEPLGGDRAQLYRERWESGERVEREPVGSPAPMPAVQRHAEHLMGMEPSSPPPPIHWHRASIGERGVPPREQGAS